MGNYTYLTCQNFVCQHSVVAETIGKQRALFAFIVPDFHVLGHPVSFTSRYCWHSKHQANVNTTWRDSARLWSPGGEAGTGAFRLFPRPRLFHATEVEEALEREPACVASKVCQLDDPARVVVLLSMLSGEIYLRLKPYLVVKISSDVVTKHFCQVCILFMMLCRSDCWLCADAVSDHGDCAIRQLVGPGSSEYHVVWLHLGRPTWDTKEIFFTFDFNILHWQRHIGAKIISPCWPIYRNL